MKIGIVSPGGFGRDGRVIPVLLALVERLARAHEVHVFTLYQEPAACAYPLCGATVHNVGGNAGGLGTARQISRAWRAICAEHRNGRFAVLHGLWLNESGLAAALAARRLAIPAVSTAGGGEFVALPEIGYGAQLRARDRWKVRLTLTATTTLTVATRYMQDLAGAFGVGARLIPLGVDCRRFRPFETRSAAPPWRLIHVANLNRVKDQPTLLRAVKRIAQCEPRVTLDILGHDALGGGIQKLACELGVAEFVHFHGQCDTATVARYLQRSHLLLHTSRFEAGPVVVLEAAACGVPSAGTAVGHIADLAPRRAIAVPVGDDRALAQAALALLHAEELRMELGIAAREFACLYDADWTAREFERLYAEVSVGGVRTGVRKGKQVTW